MKAMAKPRKDFNKYRTRGGRRTTWPHYNYGRYEVVDAGSFISLWFHRDKGDSLGDDAVGFASENLGPVIKMLQKAYNNRNWYKDPEYLYWREHHKFRHKGLRV